MRKITDIKSLSIINLILVSILVTGIILFNKFYIPDTEHVRLEDMKLIVYSEFSELLDQGQIEYVYMSEESNNCYIKTFDGDYHKFQNPQSDDFKYSLLQKDVVIEPISELITGERIESKRVEKRNVFIFFSAAILGWFVIKEIAIICRKYQDNEIELPAFKKKAAVSPEGSKVSRLKDRDTDLTTKKFSDIAGLKEVKKDISSIVDFLINKDKYVAAGAVLPKGIILYGPPGTGKTLLAKAIAGEAGVPFLYASGSDFIEMYVGVGAKRIRELFSKARKQSPCIIFIDEIDAIGGKRTGAENSEDRKTINALLTEMDGFDTLDNVIVIGATNRIEDLDPALMRPGRFSDKFCVPLPETVAERKEVIEIYAKNKSFSDDFDINALAKETIGFSPAKIESLLNEAAIIQVQEGSEYINKEIIDKAMYKILLNGHQKEDSSERKQEELNLVAYHEAGHALVGRLFGKEITKVTITQSTSGAGGVTFSMPTKMSLLSSEDIKHEVMELYGGRIGELFYYKGDRSKITTGASNDIERATSIISDYVTKYGMAEEFGMINLDVCELDKEYVMEIISKMAKEIENDTVKVVEENLDKLERLASLLIEKETITENEVNEIIDFEDIEFVAV